jgi:hypothetical protein
MSILKILCRIGIHNKWVYWTHEINYKTCAVCNTTKQHGGEHE